MHTIRRYEGRDREGLARCFIELQEYERVIDPYTLPAEPLVETYLETLFKTCAERQGTIFVAEVEGEIAGYASLFVVRDDDPLTALREYMYLNDLVVLPAYRGRGIAQALMQQGENYALEMGHTHYMLTVLANNPTAQRSYEHFGFRPFTMKMHKQLRA